MIKKFEEYLESIVEMIAAIHRVEYDVILYGGK